MDALTQDLSGLYGTHKLTNGKEITVSKKGSNLDLDMTDFIQLMITQLTSQGIDDTMDTSEMLNQMVQMQMITSMVNMTDAVTMNYSASLVGKYVTVGSYGDDGKLQEIYGEVTGTGTMDGQQVIFIDNDKYYYLSDIMAVGKLPPPKEEDKDDGKTEASGSAAEGSESAGGTGSTGDTDSTEGSGSTETVQPGSGAENPEYSGENGTPNEE